MYEVKLVVGEGMPRVLLSSRAFLEGSQEDGGLHPVTPALRPLTAVLATVPPPPTLLPPRVRCFRRRGVLRMVSV